MEAEKKEVVYNRAKVWQIILFTMNDVSYNVYFFAISFLSYYINGIIGLATVTVAYLLTAMRVFDGITDPLIGVLLDKCDTKFGKFRPFMVAGNVIMAVSLLIMFFAIPGIENGTVRTIVFLVIYVIYILGYTCQGAATRGGQSTLTNDPKQRPMVSVVSGTGCMIVYTVLGLLVSGTLITKHGAMNEAFFQDLAICTIILSGVLTILAVIGIWEKDQPKYYANGTKKEGEVKKVKFKEYVDVIKGNKGLQYLILAASTDKLASTVSGNAIVSVMVYGIVCGNYALLGEVGVYSMIPTLIILLLGAMYAGRMGQRKAVVIFSSLAILFKAATLGLFIFGDPTLIGVSGSLTVVFIVLYVLTTGCAGIPSSLVIPMIADCSDYEIYRTGRYVPGLMGTLFSFVDKTISAFGTTIVGLLIATIGYTAVQPTIDDPLTTKVFVMAMFLWCGLPIIGWVCSLIAMKLSPLTKEKMVEVQEKIAEIKAQAAEE